jgi:hypothetical protein
MSVTKRAPIRFGLLTALVWLVVAAGSIFLLWQIINRISVSNLPISTATPNQTQVYQTIAAIVNSQMTSSATQASQTGTPSPTLKPTLILATADPSSRMTPTPGGVTQTATPTALCDLAGAGNPLDITIPDDSQIEAGESFIKTWKLVNTGTCTWTTSYAASFFYGDRMGAPASAPLQANVLPAQSIEISVEMISPTSAGTYQGNWKLMNPAGELFGIGPNGDLPFWVRITVPESQTSTVTVTPGASPTQGATPTNNPTISPSPTFTATPPIQAGGELSPAPGDAIDLDNLTLNSGDEDLLYHVDTNNYHWLTPENNAMIGVFSSQEPSLPGCQSASMSHAPIAVESLPIGTYLCYSTNEGRLGRALLKAVDPNNFTLTLDLLTWALP